MVPADGELMCCQLTSPPPKFAVNALTSAEKWPEVADDDTTILIVEHVFHIHTNVAPPL